MAKSKTHTASPPAQPVKSGISRRALLTGAAIVAGGVLPWILPGSTERTNAPTIAVWQSPTHDCCTGWVSYLRKRGYRVTVNNVADMVQTKVDFGIPDAVYSCHTAQVGGYFIEGHVPVMAIAKLLDERPALMGIALPGMPAGPPGMGGSSGRYRVVGFTADGSISHFADVGI